ncbi:unnamed protein product [Chrysoparadoxa australica]
MLKSVFIRRPRVVAPLQRYFHASSQALDKILCVLYPDPEGGMPDGGEYIRDAIPYLHHYPDGSTTPTPDKVDFKPGELLGCVSGHLGLRDWLESEGHEFICTADKEGEESVLERNLHDADFVISQPFYPAYFTRSRLEKAPKLKAAITAGIGSDHVDLEAAAERNVDVCEITYSNSISVAEHVVMMILALVRNYPYSYGRVMLGGWNVADCAQKAYDVEKMKVGTVAAGRIGLAVLKRMHAFDCELHYTDRHRLPEDVEKLYNLKYWESWQEMVEVGRMDVVTLNCPLHSETEHMINDETIKLFKRGAYLVNTARGKLCETDTIVKASALETGRLGGYAGDVWFPQPAPVNHPWRTMAHHGMTPHVSGTTLSAQARYAAGVREILECYLSGKPIREEYQIVTKGCLAGAGAHSYSEGNCTEGAA